MRFLLHLKFAFILVLVCVSLYILIFVDFDEQSVTRYARDPSYSMSNDICKNNEVEIFAVLLITSFTGHSRLRAAHRAAIPQWELDELGFLRVFLIGQVSGINQSVIQQQLWDEQNKFGDLLQGHFVDKYRNNNYKTFMGFAWACFQCRDAAYVVKLNDDVVFDVFHLWDYLLSLEQNKTVAKSSGFLAGMKFSNSSPQRGEDNKFYVTHEEYNGTVYPNYVSGGMYITTLPTVRRLIEEAGKKPAFWIDDIWITGMLRERLKIPITELNSWFVNDSRYFECCVRDLKEHDYECGYYVGPLEGKTNLLVEFLNTMRKCSYDNCQKRPFRKSLLETCKLKGRFV